MSSVQIRKLNLNEFKQAQAFYLKVGYTLELSKANSFFGAFCDSELIGIVRLALENQIYVLRGMQIAPEFQFCGYGTKLLECLIQELGSEECYCLPHRWLEKFYGQVGFEMVSNPDLAPAFLTERLIENRKKYPHLILMKRPVLR